MHFVLVAIVLSASTGEASYQRLADFDTEAACQAHITADIVKPTGGQLRILKCITGAKEEPKKPPGDMQET